MAKAIITLGTTEIAVVPITLGVLKRMGMGAAKQAEASLSNRSPMEREEAWYEGAYMALSAGTGMQLPELECIEGVTRPQLLAALEVVYVTSGLVTKEEPKPEGEGMGS